MTYHVDHFYAAVSVLAGNGHVKQRLIKAFEGHLGEVSAEDLPVAQQEPFSDLCRRLTRVTPLKGESSICATVRKMSAEQAARCARSLVAIYSEIARLDDGGDNPVVVEEDELAVVPPFLVKSAS